MELNTATATAGLAAADPHGLYDVLKMPFKTVSELCLGIPIPSYFPPKEVALLWINVFEAFPSTDAFAWALVTRFDWDNYRRTFSAQFCCPRAGLGSTCMPE
jgi:hypothetical protein